MASTAELDLPDIRDQWWLRLITRRWPPAVAWILAAFLGVFGAAADLALDQIRTSGELHFFPPAAAALAALLFGLGPGVLAAVITTVLSDWLLIEPVGRVFDSFDSFLLLALDVGAALAIAGLVATLRGAIEEADRLRRSAEAMAEMRRKVLSVVAHDLRGPLTSVRLQTQVLERLLETGADAERLRPAVGMLDRTTVRALGLVRDLFDAMRLQLGAMQVRPHGVEPAELLRGVSEVHGAIAAEKGVTLVVDPADGLPGVRADRADQILGNLVANAVRFTPAGGTVRVSAQAGADVVRFDVVDEGPGIDPGDQDRVFGRFWQGGNSNDGAGLGLSIAKGLVEANRGRIGLESTPGAGSRFWFTLPLDRRAPT